MSEQNPKNGKQHKNNKKKREKSTRKQDKKHNKKSKRLQSKRPTKRTERIKNCSKRGSSTTEMLSQQNSAKIEINKMSKKKTKQ